MSRKLLTNVVVNLVNKYARNMAFHWSIFLILIIVTLYQGFRIRNLLISFFWDFRVIVCRS